METERYARFNKSISDLNKSLNALKAKGMSSIGLKAVHTVILSALFENPNGMRLNDIVEASGNDKSIVSRTLKQLIEKNYVMAVGDEGKYNTVYHLNPATSAETSYMIKTISFLITQITEDIDEQELLIFYKVLNQFINNFEKVNNSITFDKENI